LNRLCRYATSFFFIIWLIWALKSRLNPTAESHRPCRPPLYLMMTSSAVSSKSKSYRWTHASPLLGEYPTHIQTWNLSSVGWKQTLDPRDESRVLNGISDQSVSFSLYRLLWVNTQPLCPYQGSSKPVLLVLWPPRGHFCQTPVREKLFLCSCYSFSHLPAGSKWASNRKMKGYRNPPTQSRPETI